MSLRAVGRSFRIRKKFRSPPTPPGTFFTGGGSAETTPPAGALRSPGVRVGATNYLFVLSASPARIIHTTPVAVTLSRRFRGKDDVRGRRVYAFRGVVAF